jgi:hypothetical protein
MVLTISTPASASRGAAVVSFCLNCSYKPPFQRVFLGTPRAATSLRPRLLHLAAISEAGAAAPGSDQSAIEPLTPPAGNPRDYSRHLRAIGQDLEKLRLTRFNLECTGPSYLVWTRGDAASVKTSRSLLSNPLLRNLWKNRSAPRSQGKEESVALPSRRRVTRYCYTQRHIDAIELAARTRRQLRSGSADGHSLSQLLRSAGCLIEQRNQKLLGIAWQETSVSIVYEDVGGRRGIDVLRPDELYDFWVKMYLQRNGGALPSYPS